MEHDSDAELMAKTRAGDQQAFAYLVDRYKDVLVNLLTRLTGARDHAEDLAVARVERVRAEVRLGEVEVAAARRRHSEAVATRP